MRKVYLGVGHGGKDSGAVGYIVEKDVNLQMALACKEYLETNGVEVRISRTSDIDKDLTQRIKECNAYGPDLAVDIHNNAGGGDGFEVYHTLGGGTGKVLAQNIEEEIKSIGQNSRGLKTRANSQGKDYFGFIRQVKCPSIITETVFVDNEADASQADELEEQRIFGQAIAKGILRTLNIETSNSGQSTATMVTENQNVATNKEFEKHDKRIGEYQVLLNQLYNTELNIDNWWGEKTANATKKYVALKNGSKGNLVRWYQSRLRELGYDLGTTGNNGVDGDFRSKCEKTTREFQEKYGLDIDGVAGIQVIRKLVQLM